MAAQLQEACKPVSTQNKMDPKAKAEVRLLNGEPILVLLPMLV